MANINDAPPPRPYSPIFYCEHCNKPWHRKKNCFKLHGKEHVLSRGGVPQNLQQNQAHVAMRGTDLSSFSQNDVERLQSLLAAISKPSGFESLPITSKNMNCRSFTVCDVIPKNAWILDSGATNHMTFDSTLLSSYTSPSSIPYITVADGSHARVVGIGNIDLQPSLKLQSMLHVPTLSNNLISIRRLTRDRNCKVTFFASHCVFQDLNSGQTIGIAKEKEGLYYFSDEPGGPKVLSSSLLSESSSSASQIWLQHKRLGHPPFSLIKSMYPELFLRHSVESFKCDVCEFAKHHRVSFSPNFNKSVEPFNIIHSDVWGPAPTSNVSGAKWFVSFIDDCTRLTWVFLMNTKSEVPQLFIQFYNMVKTQFGKGIKRLRSDNGKEYVNHTFSDFTSKHGIIHEFTCVDTPQQNGVAERKNRHLLEVARCLMFQMSVPNSYWGEAVLTAVYLINRVMSRALGNTSPIKSMLSHFPSAPILQNLKTRVFGCVAFVHVHKQYRNKLDPRAIRCIFLGYAPNKRGYKCYHPPSRKFFISRDVTFHENVSYFTRPQSQGENINDLESESEFLVLGPSLPRTHVHAPTSVLEESTPSAPIQEYQRRSKLVPLQQQTQSSEPVVSTENDHPNDNSHISDTCDTNPNDVPLALGRKKRTCPSIYRRHASNFVSSIQLSPQYEDPMKLCYDNQPVLTDRSGEDGITNRTIQRTYLQASND
ncbi:myosin-16 [Trifolium repens]|nr:myosin-16 [Trifolium repens]